MPPSSHIPVAFTSPSSWVTIGLRVFSPPRPDGAASYALRVPRAGILRTASFRFHLTVDTLAVRLTIPITRARRGLAPPSVRQGTTPYRIAYIVLHAMPGTRKKDRVKFRPCLLTQKGLLLLQPSPDCCKPYEAGTKGKKEPGAGTGATDILIFCFVK